MDKNTTTDWHNCKLSTFEGKIFINFFKRIANMTARNQNWEYDKRKKTNLYVGSIEVKPNIRMFLKAGH